RHAEEECDIALLPIGAIEQHGPHCPAGSDTLNAIGIAEKIFILQMRMVNVILMIS
ncbi:MAG: creatininase family protein, partial [bacterium]